jgi:site-specific DNA-methyltransferase (adenine-specific)
MNRTLVVEPSEAQSLLSRAIQVREPISTDRLSAAIVHQDFFECIAHLPSGFVDLAIIDPPYNLDKKFGATKFSKSSNETYEAWLKSWLVETRRLLKPNATVYVCGDWRSSAALFNVLSELFIVRNRITWEREKGRGALSNWKNCSEDIWFCTMSDDFYFDVEAVKLKRKVIAPYRDSDGKPKDWEETTTGKFRLTHPSNLWTDISIPFWSMPENTDHPTQKPEKLIAKLVLASSKPGDFIFDPFVGSGTTCVVASKLKREFCGIEQEAEYCQIAMKRLDLARLDDTIQGYFDGFFWERNSGVEQKLSSTRKGKPETIGSLGGLFDV